MSAAPSTSEVREAALCYLEKGLSILALRRHEKTPIESQEKFTTRPILPGQVHEVFTDGRNIGGYTGLNSGNLVSMDIDRVSLFQTVARKRWSRVENRRFDEIEASTPTQETASARREPGRRQIFFRTAEPLKTVNFNSTLGYELRAQSSTANSHYCALPPSLVSKNGQFGLYSWLNDITKTPILELPLSDIEFLRPEKFDIENFKTQSRPYGLPWKFYEILRFGKFEKHGYTPKANSGRTGTFSNRTRSEAEYSAVLCMVRNGVTRAEVQEVFEGIAHEATKYRQLPATLRFSYVSRAYDDAHKYLESNPSPVDMFVKDHWHRVLENSLNARSAAGASAVYQGLLTIAKRVNELEIAASRRELAELAGMSQRWVGNHIERLYAQGYVDKGRAGTTVRASTFILKPVSNCHHSVNPPSFNGMGSFDTRKTDGHKDLFRQRGLGKTGLIVFEALKAMQPIEADRLTDALPVRISRRTVFRKLEIMQRAGLAVSDCGKWLVCGDDMELAARKLNVNGAAAKQRLLHHQERIEHRRNLAEEREAARIELKELTALIGVANAAKAIGEDITTVSRWQLESQYISKKNRDKIRQATMTAKASEQGEP